MLKTEEARLTAHNPDDSTRGPWIAPANYHREHVATTGMTLKRLPSVKFHPGEVGKRPYWTMLITTNAKANPNNGSGTSNPIVVVPQGYAYYWTQTSGSSWSMNPSIGFHGPEGIGHLGDGGYFDDLADAGALVSKAGLLDNTQYFAPYTKDFDTSRGGSTSYLNRDLDSILLDFAINDRLTDQDYADNQGFMNHYLVIYPVINR